MRRAATRVCCSEEACRQVCHGSRCQRSRRVGGMLVAFVVAQTVHSQRFVAGGRLMVGENGKASSV